MMNPPHLQIKQGLILRAFRILLFSCLWVCTAWAATGTGGEPGFTPLFDGRLLTGWRGVSTQDPRRWMALPPVEFKWKHSASIQDIHQHWRVQNGDPVTFRNLSIKSID